MAPSATSQNGHSGEQDLDLTSSAVEHRLAENEASSTNTVGAPNNGVSQPNVNELDASKLTYTFTTSPRDPPGIGCHRTKWQQHLHRPHDHGQVVRQERVGNA
ncbi:hypothetical protein NPX13_g8162 [Xylaria arbuscula]|uniref:Uncharacterized protein n=1 Tax=Xylaria arbuscula TaxID=114810 RepID=A0A9W8TK34_9PEZI|nr:hypothetical protein NPX13_g8162 [Xylaria arbuscula]